MKLVPVAVGFLVLLLGIIYAADTGRLGPLAVVYSFRQADKAGHFILLGTLALLVDRALLQVWPRVSAWTLAAVGSLTIAALISLEELSQLWVPTRTADWFDLLSSFAGIAVGTLVALTFADYVRAPKRSPGNTAYECLNTSSGTNPPLV